MIPDTFHKGTFWKTYFPNKHGCKTLRKKCLGMCNTFQDVTVQHFSSRFSQVLQALQDPQAWKVNNSALTRHPQNLQISRSNGTKCGLPKERGWLHNTKSQDTSSNTLHCWNSLMLAQQVIVNLSSWDYSEPYTYGAAVLQPPPATKTFEVVNPKRLIGRGNESHYIDKKYHKATTISYSFTWTTSRLVSAIQGRVILNLYSQVLSSVNRKP